MNKLSLLSLMLVVTVSLQLYGQNPVSGARNDSNHVYSRLERFSSKRKITRLVFPLVFKPTETVLNRDEDKPARPETSIEQVNYEGKIIRNVKIITLDPFGFDVNDSMRKPHSGTERTWNNLHVKTLPITIRNYLLFKQNDRFDSLIVQESERLVRKQRFIRDLSMKPVLVSADSIDIIIRVQDVWSIVPDGSFNKDSFTIKLKEDNFIGTGHEMNYTNYHEIFTKKNAYEVGYEIPNIDNSYITASFNYNQFIDRSFSKSLDIERPFYSSYAHWAGGALIKQIYQKDSLILSDEHRIQQIYKLNTYDYWFGGARQILHGRSEIERNINLVATGRWLQNRYIVRPSEILDSLNNFVGETTYLLSVGINSRKYVQDKFLFRYGVPEDIPIGRVYSVLGGYRIRNGIHTAYLGTKIALGDFYSWGYLAANFEYGTFFNATGFEEAALDLGISYFTNLMKVGNWRFRQFLKTNAVFGFSRLPFETVTFNDYMGVNGFDGGMGRGTQKMLFTIQTQSYAPWNLLGFRIGPFLNASMGMLGDEKYSFNKSRLYSYFGLGVLVNNDFLNASFLHLSLTYYPFIPVIGNRAFRTNTVQPSDFKLLDFEQGKPDIVPFH